MLPEGASPEYVDRQTLWNVVEAREKRKAAQLAREFVVALPREFDLQEQIEVLWEYVQESFVDKGMIADFAVHDKGDGNPHSHIMLTMRDVTSDGFGRKNTGWNDKGVFLEWRKNWAVVNNRMFEYKGLAEHIDHRSYKDQGLDREPMLHLGHEAAALERKGVKTDRGDYNSEVQKCNLERASLKEAKPQEEKSPESAEHKKKSQRTEWYGVELREIVKEAKLEKELQKMRKAKKTVQRMGKSFEAESGRPFISELEKRLKAEKAMR